MFSTCLYQVTFHWQGKQWEFFLHGHRRNPAGTSSTTVAVCQACSPQLPGSDVGFRDLSHHANEGGDKVSLTRCMTYAPHLSLISKEIVISLFLGCLRSPADSPALPKQVAWTDSRPINVLCMECLRDSEMGKGEKPVSTLLIL